MEIRLFPHWGYDEQGNAIYPNRMDSSAFTDEARYKLFNLSDLEPPEFYKNYEHETPNSKIILLEELEPAKRYSFASYQNRFRGNMVMFLCNLPDDIGCSGAPSVIGRNHSKFTERLEQLLGPTPSDKQIYQWKKGKKVDIYRNFGPSGVARYFEGEGFVEMGGPSHGSRHTPIDLEVFGDKILKAFQETLQVKRLIVSQSLQLPVPIALSQKEVEMYEGECYFLDVHHKGKWDKSTIELIRDTSWGKVL